DGVKVAVPSLPLVWGVDEAEAVTESGSVMVMASTSWQLEPRADLTFYDAQDGTLTLTMQDTHGKTLIHNEIQSTKGSNAIRLDLSGLDSGIYYVSLRGANGRLTKKLVKL
ncbi:MAG: Secretion system C-terminal sorting domain, partial [Bacteroidota bacterium]